MSEQVRLWSVTELAKIGLGTSKAIVESNKIRMAELAFDLHKRLGHFVEDDDRDGAVTWLKGKYWDVQEKAMARGTEVHKIAEKIALGAEAVEVDPAVQPYVDQYVRFLEDWRPEYELSESPVYNLTYHYAGTLDAIAVIEGRRLLLDMKTTPHGPDAVDRRGKPRSRPPYAEIALQLTMYRRAELVGLIADRIESNYRRYYVFDPDKHTEPMPQVDGAACLVVSPADYMLVPIRTDDEVWRYVLHMREMAKWHEHVSKQVVGRPASPKQEVRND